VMDMEAGFVTRGENSCSICLEEFQGGQKQRVLSCSHVFHAACVDEWLAALRSACSWQCAPFASRWPYQGCDSHSACAPTCLSLELGGHGQAPAPGCGG
jgi:hypothetical protein